MSDFPIELDVSPVAGRIGGEVSNLQLTGELDDHTMSALHRALGRYKVLFFRKQHHMDDREQQAFGLRLRAAT